MAKKGNSFLLQVASTYNGGTYSTVAGMTTTALTINKSSVDITTKDSSNWTELLPGGGVKAIAVTADGIWAADSTQDLLRQAVLASTHWNFQLVDEDGNAYAGAYNVDSFALSGDANAEEDFSISLSSSGEITYTAA